MNMANSGLSIAFKSSIAIRAREKNLPMTAFQKLELRVRRHLHAVEGYCHRSQKLGSAGAP